METNDVVLADQVAVAIAEGEGVYAPGEPFAMDADGGAGIWALQQAGMGFRETVELLRAEKGIANSARAAAYNRWMASLGSVN